MFILALCTSVSTVCLLHVYQVQFIHSGAGLHITHYNTQTFGSQTQTVCLSRLWSFQNMQRSNKADVLK